MHKVQVQIGFGGACLGAVGAGWKDSVSRRALRPTRGSIQEDK